MIRTPFGCTTAVACSGCSTEGDYEWCASWHDFYLCQFWGKTYQYWFCAPWSMLDCRCGRHSQGICTSNRPPDRLCTVLWNLQMQANLGHVLTWNVDMECEGDWCMPAAPAAEGDLVCSSA